MDPSAGKYRALGEEGVSGICSSERHRAALEKPVWCVSTFSTTGYCAFLQGCTVHAGTFSQLRSCLRDEFGVAEGTGHDHATFLT